MATVSILDVDVGKCQCLFEDVTFAGTVGCLCGSPCCSVQVFVVTCAGSVGCLCGNAVVLFRLLLEVRDLSPRLEIFRMSVRDCVLVSVGCGWYKCGICGMSVRDHYWLSVVCGCYKCGICRMSVRDTISLGQFVVVTSAGSVGCLCWRSQFRLVCRCFLCGICRMCVRDPIC